MVMDAAKTHNSTPPPGGGWVDAGDEGDSATRRGHDGVATSKTTSSRRRTTTTATEDMVPPDGGWGWVIVLANCINLGMVFSVVGCYGVMYVPLVALGYSNTQVSFIPSVYMGISSLLGPVSTGLSHYYTARQLTMIGNTMIVIGIFLCSLYKNISWIFLCFGVISGLGCALATPHGFLLGQKYFQHKRVMANGLSMAGGSLGMMFLPPLMGYLVETYAVEGAFMLWAGIVLQSLIGVVLFQPVEWHLKPKKAATLDTVGVQQNISQTKNNIPGSKIIVGGGKVEDLKECGSGFENDSIVKHLTPDDKDSSDDSDNEDLFIAQKDVTLDTHDQGKDVSDPADLCSERQWKNPLTDVLQTNEYLERPRTVSIERSMEILPQIPEESEDEDCFETYDPESGNERIEFLNHENEMRNRPVSYISTKSVDSIAKIPLSESVFNSTDVLDQFGSALSLKVEKLKDSVQADATDRSRKCDKSNNVDKQPLKPYILCGLKLPRLSYIINLSVLRHPLFFISSFSSICNRMVFSCMMAYVPSFGHDIGVGSGAPYLLTILAACETLAKVIMSIITDQGFLQRRYIFMLATTTSAVAIFCMTLSWNIASLGVCCGLYGFGVGTAMAVGPVLMVEYFSLKLLPHTFGLMLFMNGIAQFAIFPLTGSLSDLAGNFITTFYILGCLAVVPVFLWSFAPCFRKMTDEASKTPADNV